MSDDRDRDTRPPRFDKPSDGPVDPAMGNIGILVGVLALAFVAGFVWLMVGGDGSKVATSDSPPAPAATTGTGSN